MSFMIISRSSILSVIVPLSKALIYVESVVLLRIVGAAKQSTIFPDGLGSYLPSKIVESTKEVGMNLLHECE